jgi:hypothetical protein
MRRFNDRNSNTGYLKIIDLIAKHNSTTFVEYNSPDEVDPTFNPVVDDKYIEFVNGKVDKVIDKNNYLYRSIITEKRQMMYNHRNEYENRDKLWPYMMNQYYQKYVSTKLCHCDLTAAFCLRGGTLDDEFERLIFEPNHKLPVSEFSMVNMLIYGKTNVNFDSLSTLLSYVRIKTEDMSIQLDNYVIVQHMYSSKRYDIKWNQDNIKELQFALNDRDKLDVAKYLIQLMNEVDPTLLNFNNYYQICCWYRLYDLPIQLIHGNIHTEIQRVKTMV